MKSQALTIYRIQHIKTQTGPYRMSVRSWTTQNHNNLPLPEEDEGIRDLMNKSLVCGFKDLGQLVQWFTKKELRNLEKMGYKVCQVKVPEKKCIIGSKQVVFPKKFIKQAEVLKVNIDTIYRKGKLVSNSY